MKPTLTIPERVAAEAQRRVVPEVVPRSFVAFCAWLNVTLTNAQRVVSMVAYDGVEPRDLGEADREIARGIFGAVDVVPSRARDVVVAVCGARAGKTYIIESLRLLHLALTVPVTLAPGEVASAPIIQPDTDLAQQALNYVVGAIESKPALLRLVSHRHQGESIEITRADGVTVEIVCRAASTKGRTGRGRTLVGAAMGEAAFFRDRATGKVNDTDIFDALTPRIAEGGQLIVSSTPYGMTGVLYDLFIGNHPDPSVAGISVPSKGTGDALAIHAPTLTLRDNDPKLTAWVAKAYARDPANAAREYGAQFMSSGASLFFDANALNAAIRHDIALPLRPQPGDRVSAGGDTGFEKNSSTLAIVHQRGGRYLTAEIYERKPEPGAPLKPSEVVADFVEVMQRHGAKYFVGDAHYRATVLEHLTGTGIHFVAAPTSPEEAFVRVNALLREGLVELPNNERLVRQLRETMKRPRPGGGVSVVLPTWLTGEHGDLAAAWVLAVYQAYGQKVPDGVAEQGTAEWESAQHSKRADAARKAGANKGKAWWR